MKNWLRGQIEVATRDILKLEGAVAGWQAALKAIEEDERGGRDPDQPAPAVASEAGGAEAATEQVADIAHCDDSADAELDAT